MQLHRLGALAVQPPPRTSPDATSPTDSTGEPNNSAVSQVTGYFQRVLKANPTYERSQAGNGMWVSTLLVSFPRNRRPPVQVAGAPKNNRNDADYSCAVEACRLLGFSCSATNMSTKSFSGRAAELSVNHIELSSSLHVKLQALLRDLQSCPHHHRSAHPQQGSTSPQPSATQAGSSSSSSPSAYPEEGGDPRGVGALRGMSDAEKSARS
eukprot:RCo030088